MNLSLLQSLEVVVAVGGGGSWRWPFHCDYIANSAQLRIYYYYYFQVIVCQRGFMIRSL